MHCWIENFDLACLWERLRWSLKHKNTEVLFLEMGIPSVLPGCEATTPGRVTLTCPMCPRTGEGLQNKPNFPLDDAGELRLLAEQGGARVQEL